MRWKLAAVAGWTLVGVVALAGAEPGREGRFRRLVIEDERGRPLIEMGAQEFSGEPLISVRDVSGHVQASIVVHEYGGGFRIDNDRTRSSVEIGMGTKGASVELTNGQTKQNVTLTVPTAEPPR